MVRIGSSDLRKYREGSQGTAPGSEERTAADESLMFLEKINVWSIIANHVDTLRDYGTDKRSYADLLLFFALPVAVAGFAFWRGTQLRAIAVTDRKSVVY